MKISVAWQGIGAVKDELHAMKDRTDKASHEGVMRGATIIQEQARVNTRFMFVDWTGRLSDSIVTSDAAHTGDGSWSAKAFPSGGPDPGTPYGRIQELGGEIVAHNPTGLLWWEGFRADGSFGLISKPSVTLKPHPYLRDALETSMPALRDLMVSVWGQAIEA